MNIDWNIQMVLTYRKMTNMWRNLCESWIAKDQESRMGNDAYWPGTIRSVCLSERTKPGVQIRTQLLGIPGQLVPPNRLVLPISKIFLQKLVCTKPCKQLYAPSSPPSTKFYLSIIIRYSISWFEHAVYSSAVQANGRINTSNQKSNQSNKCAGEMEFGLPDCVDTGEPSNADLV